MRGRRFQSGVKPPPGRDFSVVIWCHPDTVSVYLALPVYNTVSYQAWACSIGVTVTWLLRSWASAFEPPKPHIASPASYRSQAFTLIFTCPVVFYTLSNGLYYIFFLLLTSLSLKWQSPWYSILIYTVLYKSLSNLSTSSRPSVPGGPC